MWRFYCILLIISFLGLSNCVKAKNTTIANTLPESNIVLAKEISLLELAGTWKFKTIFTSLEDRNWENFNENVEKPILNYFNGFSIVFNLSESEDNLANCNLVFNSLPKNTFLAWTGHREDLDLSSFFCRFNGDNVAIFSEDEPNIPLLTVYWTLAKNQLILGKIDAKSQDLFGIKNYILKESVWLFSNK